MPLGPVALLEVIRIPCLLICAAFAPEPVDIQSDTLDNGMVVLVVEEAFSGVAAVQMWYRVGTVNERDEQGGMAHMTEHLMFNGSAGPANMFSEKIEETGGEDNAWTDLDVTVYHSVVPPEAVKMVISMEADRMFNLTFSNFYSERDVVMEERRLTAENDIMGEAYESLWAFSYLVHPYRNPTLGWDFSINSFTPHGIREFYRTYYWPSRATLVVVGDVKADSVFSWAREYFGHLPNPESEIPEVSLVEPEQCGERVWIIHRETAESVYLASYHVPEASNPDMPGLELLAAILGNGKISRLYRSLVKEKELAISVQVFVTKNRYPGLLVIELVLQKGVDPADVSLALDTEMERLIREGISDEEIARARRQCLAELVYRREYPEDLGFYLGESAVITGDPEYLNRYPTLLSSLTAEDLVRIAGKYLIPEKRTVVAITPKPTLN